MALCSVAVCLVFDVLLPALPRCHFLAGRGMLGVSRLSIRGLGAFALEVTRLHGEHLARGGCDAVGVGVVCWE